MKRNSYIATLDFDPAKLKDIGGGQYVVPTGRAWKEGIVFKFPKGLPQVGAPVVVHFTRETRRNYSTPDPEKPEQKTVADLPPGTYGVRLMPIKTSGVWGTRDVVRIYPATTDRAPRYRLVLAGWPTRATMMGGSTVGHLAGNIIFEVTGHSRSATGRHGEVHVCAVVDGSAETVINRVSNSLNVSEERIEV